MGLSFGKSFGNHIASVGHLRELITSWNCLFQFCWTYLIVQLSLVSFCRVKLLIWPGIHYCCLDTETDDTTFNKIGKNGGDERNQDRLLEFPVYRISWCVHDIPNKLVSLVFVPVVINDLLFLLHRWENQWLVHGEIASTRVQLDRSVPVLCTVMGPQVHEGSQGLQAGKNSDALQLHTSRFERVDGVWCKFNRTHLQRTIVQLI